MRNHGVVSLILISSLFTSQASALPKLDFQQPLILEHYVDKNDLNIPGDSPVKHCADPAHDLFRIERLDVQPNPPQRGQSCIIEVEGVFHEDVGENPMFMLNATYDSLHSIDTVERLCDRVDVVQNQALVCPPRKGRAVLSYAFFIHELMTPPGNYTQRVNAFDKNNERLFCLSSAVTF